MNEETKRLIDGNGWSLGCESPIEITHRKTGDFATGHVAEMVINTMKPLTPKKLDNPDFGQLIKLAEEYLNKRIKYGEPPEDYDNWFYEEIMKSIYGDDIFDFINSIE